MAPQVKEVLKDFIDALSTIICDEEWRTSLNINSATKKIFNNLDNLLYIQRTSFRGNDTLDAGLKYAPHSDRLWVGSAKNINFSIMAKII
ncbi:putative protein YneK [Escherichia sp. SP-MK2]